MLTVIPRLRNSIVASSLLIIALAIAIAISNIKPDTGESSTYSSYLAAIPLLTSAIPTLLWRRLSTISQLAQISTHPAPTTMTASNGTSEYKRGEVYFLSHGGPPTMFETTSKPYQAWIEYGKMVNEAKPRGLVVVSAHWEDERGGEGVTVNVASTNPLVYDFYGFPKHFYEQIFESRGDEVMLQAVRSALAAARMDVTEEKRGLDHGVWVPFKVAFNGKASFPIIQVSLPGDGSPVSAAKLGKALAPLREQGYGIMGTGQVVHNLRDLFSGGDLSYTTPYLKAVQTALHSSKPLESTLTLFRHPLYKRAHPTPEHLLPLVVAVAATQEREGGNGDGHGHGHRDSLEDIFVGMDGSLGRERDAGLGWGMWRWK